MAIQTAELERLAEIAGVLDEVRSLIQRSANALMHDITWGDVEDGEPQPGAASVLNRVWTDLSLAVKLLDGGA